MKFLIIKFKKVISKFKSDLWKSKIFQKQDL